MSLASTVKGLSKPRVVTRRPALVYDGTGPNPVAGPAEVVAVTSIAMQRGTGRAVHLVREIDGDESLGKARVWVTNKALGKTYLQGDGGQTPLGWTELRIAPPQDTDGPPGDVIAWVGRRWEIIEEQGWEEAFNSTGVAGFRRYIASDRGAA